MDLDLSNKETMESSEEDYKDPKEPMWIRRITNEPILVEEPDNFSGKEMMPQDGY